MTTRLHKRIHNVSHYQLALLDGASETGYPDDPYGAALAAFAPTGVVVSCAWDENASVAPDVDVEVRYATEAPTPASVGPLIAIAVGHMTIGTRGIEVGNWITGDITRIAVPPGRHGVGVLMDTVEPYKARTIQFVLWPLDNETL
ncbi:MAG: hypothetical protein RL291_1567 [Pseudomonadota bacterium]|jgi:hypothetical protein